MPRIFWTKDEVEMLNRHWPIGQKRPSTGWTAEKIGSLIGKSRCAVIGQAHRMRQKMELAELDDLRKFKAGVEQRV